MQTTISEFLSYLSDLGWTDLYRVPPASAVRPEMSDARPDGLVADEAGPRPGRTQTHSTSTTSTAEVSAPAPELQSAVGLVEPEVAILSTGQRLQRLEELATRANQCRSCALCETRKTVVFGSGNPDADLMFIGEGPGANEDEQGLPFVGQAGELLTKILRAIDLAREDVYIANMVKCRPPQNRDPLPGEVEACRPYLEEQITLVAPKLIVLLGGVAAKTLLGTEHGVGQLRGRWHQVNGVETMVTYHPAYLLRNASMKRPVWEDMQRVRDRLRENA